ncbi:MAG: YfcC family protein [Firmicutes bacterium]|nr:YfcC family protein [Bacillota bacterium]
MDTKPKKKFSLNTISAFAILFCIMLIVAIFTWIIPAGEFERVANEAAGGRMTVIPGTYQTIESSPVGPFQFFILYFEGFIDAADIIFFIIFSSSYVFLLTKTGALNAMTGAMLRKIGTRDHLIIPLFMIFFAIGGTTFGMFEECYALIPAFIVIAITLGYDRITGGAIVFVGVATGFAAATLNPFTIGVASKVAEIPLTTPKILAFRLVALAAFLVLNIAYVMHYALKVKKDPSKSILYGRVENLEGLQTREEVMADPFTSKQKISMVGFLVLLIILIVGIIKVGWYFDEIAALFFIFFILTAIVNGYGVNEIADTFVEAAKSTIYGALLVGAARGIALVMSAGMITDTVVNALAALVGSLPKAITGIGMLIVQNLINFFIPSGSGQAVVMMPIMAPLADVVGLSREMAVVAYQFGDGFSNMFWPTACAVECGIMAIGLTDWYKFITKLFIMMFLLQCVFMVVGVAIGI